MQQIDPSITTDVTTAVFHKLDLIIGAILALLGKLGWDKVRKDQKRLPVDGAGEVTLDSQISNRDTVMIWLTDRVHKVKNELDAPITRLSATTEELKIRTAFLEADAKDFKISTQQSIARIHDHIDNRCDRLETLIEKVRDKS
jgi:hypothetical protein